MSDAHNPSPWADEHGDATPFERRLLRDARAVAPPPGLKHELLAQVLARASAASAVVPGASSPPPAAAPAAASGAPRWAGGLFRAAVVGLASGALYFALRSDAPPARLAPSVTVSEVTLPAAPAVVEVSDTAPPAPVAPIEAVPEKGSARAEPPPEHPRSPAVSASSSGPAGASAESRLREETALVLRARERLRAANPAGALRLLQEARARFPEGALGQERETLTIEALAAEQNGGEARQRAEEFLRDNPDSPHGARVRALADEVDAGAASAGN